MTLQCCDINYWTRANETSFTSARALSKGPILRRTTSFHPSCFNSCWSPSAESLLLSLRNPRLPFPWQKLPSSGRVLLIGLHLTVVLAASWWAHVDGTVLWDFEGASDLGKCCGFLSRHLLWLPLYATSSLIWGLLCAEVLGGVLKPDHHPCGSFCVYLVVAMNVLC